jgi:hypothetical protein
MKSHAIEWTNLEASRKPVRIKPAENLDSATRLLSRSVLALVPALALVVAAAWLVSAPDLVVYLQATLWASGFLFFGLALDLEKSTIGLSLATGFALPMLAWLSSVYAPELAIVGVTIIAVWIAAAILRR